MANPTIYKRGKTYWARVVIAGRKLRRSLRTGDRTEALKRRDDWKKDLEREQFYGVTRLYWWQAVQRYIEEVMPQAVKEKTAQRYKVSFRQVDAYLREKWLDQINSADIATVVGQRKKNGATNSTIKRDLTAMSLVFRAGKAWQACDRNPPLEYDRSLVRERRDPIVEPQDKDIDAAIAAANPYMALAIRWALHSGMRQAELLTLQWRQVDLDRGAINITRTKTDRVRSIPISAQLRGTIVDTPKGSGTDLVLRHSRGTGYKNFAAQFRIWREGKYPFRFHDLRHKYAIEYLRAGGNIYDLQKILGHASIKTTERYLDFLTPEEAGIAQGTKVDTNIGGFVLPFVSRKTAIG